MNKSLNPSVDDMERIYTEVLEELEDYKDLCEVIYQRRVKKRDAFIKQEKEKYLQFLVAGDAEMCTRYEEWVLPPFVEEPPTRKYISSIETVLYWISRGERYKFLYERHPDIQDLEEIEKYGYSLKIQKWLKDEPQYNSVFDDCSDTSVPTL